MEGSQREVKAETWRQELQQSPQRSAASWLALHLQSFLSCTTQEHLPRSGTAYSRLGSPTSIRNQEIAPRYIPTGHLTKASFQLEVLSPQVNLVCVKFTKKKKITSAEDVCEANLYMKTFAPVYMSL